MREIADRGSTDPAAGLTHGARLLSDDVPSLLSPARRRHLMGVLGADPGPVRLHTGERAQLAAEALQARAFALGPSDVFLGRAAAEGGGSAGVGLLAHELAHTTEARSHGPLLHRGGAAGEDEERRAQRAEQMALAEESTVSEDVSEAEAGPTAGAEEPSAGLDDLLELEERAWRELTRRERLRRERG